MGCFEDNKYNTSYKYIFTELDIINSQNKYIYLISVVSMPNFIKIIEDSKILEIKNNSEERTIKTKESNLAKNFEDYQLEKNIKIYDDYNQCKKIGKENNQSKNEFIIVDKKFLEIINFKKIYESNTLIKFEEDTNKKEIYFLTEEQSLEIESKRCGIYRFIGDEFEENHDNNDKDSDKEKKTDAKVDDPKNKKLVLNNNKPNYEEKYKEYNDYFQKDFDNKSNNDEKEQTKDNISNLSFINHKQKNNVNNINSVNKEKNKNNSNKKEMSNTNNNIYLSDSSHNRINNDDKNQKKFNIKGHKIGIENPINQLKKNNLLSKMDYNQPKKQNYEKSIEHLKNNLGNKNITFASCFSIFILLKKFFNLYSYLIIV